MQSTFPPPMAPELKQKPLVLERYENHSLVQWADGTIQLRAEFQPTASAAFTDLEEPGIDYKALRSGSKSLDTYSIRPKALSQTRQTQKTFTDKSGVYRWGRPKIDMIYSLRPVYSKNKFIMTHGIRPPGRYKNLAWGNNYSLDTSLYHIAKFRYVFGDEILERSFLEPVTKMIHQTPGIKGISATEFFDCLSVIQEYKNSVYLSPIEYEVLHKAVFMFGPPHWDHFDSFHRVAAVWEENNIDYQRPSAFRKAQARGLRPQQTFVRSDMQYQISWLVVGNHYHWSWFEQEANGHSYIENLLGKRRAADPRVQGIVYNWVKQSEVVTLKYHPTPKTMLEYAAAIAKFVTIDEFVDILETMDLMETIDPGHFDFMGMESYARTLRAMNSRKRGAKSKALEIHNRMLKFSSERNNLLW